MEEVTCNMTIVFFHCGAIISSLANVESNKKSTPLFLVPFLFMPDFLTFLYFQNLPYPDMLQSCHSKRYS